MEKQRYNKLNLYLKEKFGERTLKICIDGGFTCPNRDGSKSTLGCAFCSAHGSGEHTRFHLDIPSQVKAHLDSYRGTRANKFIAYFQDYTNTYADINTLKQRYDSALIDERIVALAVATRPDCITEEVAQLLHSYTSRLAVSVELGFQTSNDKLGEKMNRCYSTQDFINAVKLLHKYNLEVICHIMVGLGESEKDIVETINIINSLEIEGVKIHSTYVVRGSTLEKLYNENKFTPISLEEYLSTLCKIISMLRPQTVIHRLSGDAPNHLLVSYGYSTQAQLKGV